MIDRFINAVIMKKKFNSDKAVLKSSIFFKFLKQQRILLLLSIILFAGCKKLDIKLYNPNDYYRPAGEFLQNNFEFSLFAAIINEVGLTEKLNEIGPYTILAPNNEAFEQFGIKSKDDIKRFSKEQLLDLVERHIILGKVSQDDIPVNSLDNLYLSLNDSKLLISKYNKNDKDYGFSVNGAHISPNNANVFVANGLLHELNKVIKYSDKPILEWMEEQGDFKILLAGLKKFGITDHILNQNEYTLMAPRDEIFEKHGITLEKIENMDSNNYGKRLFGAYLFDVRFFTTDLTFFPSSAVGSGYAKSRAAYRTTIPGDETFSHGIHYDGKTTYHFFVIETLPLEKEVPIRFIPFNIIMAKSDFSFSNGVLHEIDELILLPDESFQ